MICMRAFLRFRICLHAIFLCMRPVSCTRKPNRCDIPCVQSWNYRWCRAGCIQGATCLGAPGSLPGFGVRTLRIFVCSGGARPHFRRAARLAAPMEWLTAGSLSSYFTCNRSHALTHSVHADRTHPPIYTPFACTTICLHSASHNSLPSLPPLPPLHASGTKQIVKVLVQSALFKF